MVGMRVGGVERESGCGEENGRCVEEVWGGWRGKVGVVGVERESGCG